MKPKTIIKPTRYDTDAHGFAIPIYREKPKTNPRHNPHVGYKQSAKLEVKKAR